MRFTPNIPLKKKHRYQYIYAWFFYGLMTISWTTTKDFKQLKRYAKTDPHITGKKSYNRLLTELWASKIFYYVLFLVLPILFVPVAWYWTVLGYFTMHFVCGFILSIIFQTAHVMPSSEYPEPNKDGKMENSWAIHQMLNTANYSPNSKLFSWCIGGLNYQVEHHLFPYISHVHYKSISILVKETAAKYNLPYHVQKNFGSALAGHFRMLRTLGQ